MPLPDDRPEHERPFWCPERFARTLLEGAGEGIVVFDDRLQVRVWNRFLEERTGLAAADVLGLDANDLCERLGGGAAIDHVRRALRGETVEMHDRTIRRASEGERWYACRVDPYGDEEGRIIGVIARLRDTTERHESEERLRASEVRLHQSQRIEAVGRLAGGVAQDYNNLLTVIRANARTLLSEGAPDAPGRAELEEIAQAAERATTLTRQLLAFSRQQVLQPRVLDLNDVVREMWTLLQRLVGDAVRAEMRLSESLGPVRADRVQVEQVLLDLAGNARDAMPGGGTLVVETADVHVDDEEAGRHPPMVAGDYVRLTVHDSGVGMDAETLARAFEPFFTTKPLGAGTGMGMGLSTVYGIVKQSGGYVWAESVPNHGSSFRIYLPRIADSAAAPREPRAEPGDEQRGAPPVRETGDETIVVAEDEPLVRAVARRTLQRAGYRVLDAANGADALQLARGLEAPPDLLITDIVMPVMGGRELAAAVAREMPSTRILFMSGYAHERQAYLASGDGAVSHFLHKPFSQEELRRRVRLILDRAPATS